KFRKVCAGHEIVVNILRGRDAAREHHETYREQPNESSVCTAEHRYLLLAASSPDASRRFCELELCFCSGRPYRHRCTCDVCQSRVPIKNSETKLPSPCCCLFNLRPSGESCVYPGIVYDGGTRER